MIYIHVTRFLISDLCYRIPTWNSLRLSMFLWVLLELIFDWPIKFIGCFVELLCWLLQKMNWDKWINIEQACCRKRHFFFGGGGGMILCCGGNLLHFWKRREIKSRMRQWRLWYLSVLLFLSIPPDVWSLPKICIPFIYCIFSKMSINFFMFAFVSVHFLSVSQTVAQGFNIYPNR